ncbi:MAG: hypothetical protein ACFFD4_34750 [Candidatus Odinarchaeota archaeon]
MSEEEQELIRARSAEKRNNLLFLLFTLSWFGLFILMGSVILIPASFVYSGLYLAYLFLILRINPTGFAIGVEG